MKFWQNTCFSIGIALTVTGCGGGGGSASFAVEPIPVVTGLTAQVVSANTATLIATVSDSTGITGYCIKPSSTEPLANDACFQASSQITGVTLAPGVTYYAWAKNVANNVSASYQGPSTCGIAGYAASNLSSKTTVCMQTDKGEFVLELDAANAPITVANFLKYVSDGFYSGTTFHQVIPNFMIQGGGYTYTGANSYQLKTSTYSPIVLEKTSLTGLSNLRGTIAMARTSAPNSATNQFFINVVDNIFLDSANQIDGNGYAVFGQVISGMAVADLIKAVPFQSGTAGTNQPVTPVFIPWAYQIK